MTVAPTATTTLGGAIRAAASALRGAGLATPELDARLLAGEASGLDTAGLIAESRSLLDGAMRARLAELIARRLEGEPVARILGRREFWSLEFALSPATLVPRPDSETLVEAALAAIDASHGRDASVRLADLGTGSGCLAVALLTELPNAIAIATDISAEALATARANAARHGVSGRIAFVCGTWADALAPGLNMIVTNPPYVMGSDIEALSPEVSRHEPRLALDGGPDGLDAYRALLRSAARALAPDGALIVEIGAGQHDAVAALAGEVGLDVAGVRRDLSGRQRVIELRRIGRHPVSREKSLGKECRTG